MSVIGVKTSRQIIRWLRSRWGRQVMILGYHRIAELDHDPYGVAVRPSHFAEQLAVLRQEAHPIPLAKMCVGLHTGDLPRRAVVVTFDDGYTDLLLQARPLLAQYDIPATAFVVAGCLGQELWWDELMRLTLSPAVLPDHLTLNANGRLLTWSMFEPHYNTLRKQTPTPRQRLLMMLYRELLAQPETRASVLAQFRAWSPAGPFNHDLPGAASVMSSSQLAALVEDGLVEVGSHTMTHAALASLPAEAQLEELRQSKATLAEIVGRPVMAFSYPHGSATAVTQALVGEAGYTLAYASHNDLARRSSNPFYLPRFWPPDWDGETFARWLRRWLHG